jgi:hypothetical protein
MARLTGPPKNLTHRGNRPKNQLSQYHFRKLRRLQVLYDDLIAACGERLQWSAHLNPARRELRNE